MNKRYLNLFLGLASVGLGILGAFLPVLPSTCFFIFSAYFFSQSSPKLEAWVLNHPQFGPAVKSWQETRSISKAGKVAAVTGMSLSTLLLMASAAPLVAKFLGVSIIAISLYYVVTRPTLVPQIRKIKS